MSEKIFIPIAMAVLTVSDTRDESNDLSGAFLVEKIKEVGHSCAQKIICKDNIYEIRSIVSQWVADAKIQAVLITGGTGVFETDVTPEAVEVLFDKKIDGFGELFRMVSYDEIGTSTIQSRAVAGIANKTLIFALPGSTKACKTAWNIIEEQINSQKKHCSFINVLTKEGKK